MTALPIGGWRPIQTAPKDRLVWVATAPDRELPAIECPCEWHEQAGFCVDEIRPVMAWRELTNSDLHYWLRQRCTDFQPDKEFIGHGLVHPTDKDAPDECHDHYANAVSVLTQRRAYRKHDVAWLIAEAARLGRVPVLRNKRGETLTVHEAVAKFGGGS